MQIRLKHKDHGYHTVYNALDLKACEDNGWVRDEPEKVEIVVPAKEPVNNSSVFDGAQYFSHQRKRGKNKGRR